MNSAKTMSWVNKWDSSFHKINTSPTISFFDSWNHRIKKKMSIIAVEEKSSSTFGNNQRCFITELPEEIISLIAAFLHSSKYQNERTFEFSLDWRNFIASNQRFFTPLKKRTRLLRLTREISARFHDSLTFRTHVLSKVEDPRLQIALRVGKCENPFDQCLGQVKYLRIEHSEVFTLPFVAEEVTFSSCKLSSTVGCPSTKQLNVFHTVGCELLQFPNVEKLCVMEGSSPYNSSPQVYRFLPNLQTVEVTGSDLSDVSCFSHLQRLVLNYCPNVVDVGCLENVPDLEFRACHVISDISKLGRVHVLDISGCRGIADISTLTKVERLSMSQCPNLSNHRTTDILESLDTLVELNFAYSSLNSAPWLKNVVVLDLSYSYYLDDVSALDGSAVEELKLISCPNLSDITLRGIRVLDISDSFGITDFSGLWSVKKLTMGTTEPPQGFFITDGFQTFQQLSYLAMGVVENHQDLIPHLTCATDLKELVLTYAHFDFSELTQVESLGLNYCPDLVSVPASLRSLRSLSIYECENFTTLPDLPSLEVLRIWNCERLRVLTLDGNETSSFPVYSVELCYCANLEELRVQRRVSCMRASTVCPQLLITNEHLVDHKVIKARG
jgi:Leucine-rich repeat (LRR) protein